MFAYSNEVPDLIEIQNSPTCLLSPTKSKRHKHPACSFTVVASSLAQFEEQIEQLWDLLKADALAVEHFLLTVLQPGVGTVDMSDHQLSATGQESGAMEREYWEYCRGDETEHDESTFPIFLLDRTKRHKP